MEVISRKEAKARGLKRYFTGRPCKYGHVEQRKVSDKKCVACGRMRYRANKAELNAKFIKRRRERRRSDPLFRAKEKEWNKAYHERHRTERLAARRKYYAENVEKLRAAARARVTRPLARRYRKLPPPLRPEVSTCEICGREDDHINLDHCHERNFHRGWLCRGCNQAIGKLGDNIEGIKRALAYLERAELIYANKDLL